MQISNLPKNSYGAKTYEKYGYRGIIDEAKNGYPVIFKAINYFLNLKTKTNIDSFLYQPEKFDEKRVILIKTLLFICSNLKDTNILGKKDEDLLKYYQNLCVNAMKKRNTNNFYKDINKINKFCIENNISSGGSADLFSSAIALIKIFNLFYL